MILHQTPAHSELPSLAREPIRLQRAQGAARLVLRRRGAATCLADLRQEGCLKLRFPRAEECLAVALNTSGGAAAGDRLTLDVALEAGAAATLTTQAAERFYRARADDVPALVRSTVRLERGASLHWLPQEAILFDGSAMDRRLDVAMAEDATFLGVEALVFGRTAMGERVRSAQLADTLSVRRGGRPVLHDAIRLSGPVADILAGKAVAAGGTAVATLAFVSPHAEAALHPIRAALAMAMQAGGVEAGASAWDGMLVARLVARDGACLRAGIVAGLAAVRAEALPRMWLL